MSRHDRALEPSTAPAEQSERRAHVSARQMERGAYTITQVCERISMPRRTFTRLRDQGDLPFLEEVQPRLGKRPRYRADLVEQYVANLFNRDPLRARHGRHSAAVPSTPAMTLKGI